MMRGYAIGLGAGTQVLTHVPFFILIGKPGETGRSIMMGAGWVINIMVVEWIIRRDRGSKHAAHGYDTRHLAGSMQSHP